MTRTLDRAIPPVTRHPIAPGAPVEDWRYRPVIALEQVPQALYAWDDSDPAVVWDAGLVPQARLVFPGVAGNYAWVPDAANLRISGDIEIVHRWSCADLARQNTCLISKGNPYLLYLDGFKRIRLDVRVAGTTRTAYSGFNNAWANNTLYWTKMTRVAATGAVAFYTAPDQPTEPTTWTAAGTGTTTAGPIDTSAAPLEMAGAFSGGLTLYPGRIARSIVRNGIGGPTVLDIDENNAGTMVTASTFRATSGQTVTVVQTAGNTIVQPQPPVPPAVPPYVWDEPAVTGWVDAVCDFMVADIATGEPDELYLYPPAELTLTLHNPTGAYTPWTTDGRLAYWAPGRRVAIYAHRVADNSDWWLFNGRVASWAVNADDTVTVTAFDGLAWLAQEVGGDWTPGAAGDTVAARITAAAAAVGYPDPLRLDTGAVTLTTAPTDKAPLEVVEVAALSDGGLFYADADGTLIYTDRLWRAGRDDQPATWVVSDNVCTVPVVVWDPLMASDDERLATDVRLVNVAGLVATAHQATSVWSGDARYVLAHPDPDQWTTQAQGDALAGYLLSQQGTPAMAMRSFDIHALSPNDPALFDMAVLARRGDLVNVLHDYPDADGTTSTLDVTAVCLTIAHQITPESWVASFNLSRTVDYRVVELWDRTTYTWDDPSPLNVWRF